MTAKTELTLTSNVRNCVAQVLCVMGLLGMGLLTGCGQSQRDSATATPGNAGAARSDSGDATSAPTDHELIQGTWEVKSATINGESFPAAGQVDLHVGGRYQFDGETLTKFANPKFPGVVQTGTPHRYRLDATHHPKQIEIQMLGDGPNGAWPPERTIYELEKDSLLLCWPILEETPPPTKFESNAGENIGLYELRRIKE